MGKKRKLEVLDPDAEKTLYTSFVTAANSISSLYTQAVQQQRKSSAAASRLTLERVAAFIMREYPGQDHVPKAALLHYLHQEYEGIDGAENLPHQFPVAMYPVVGQQHGEIAGVMPSTCRPGLKAAIQQGYHVPVVRYPSSRAEG